jgi:hypothetical protein
MLSALADYIDTPAGHLAPHLPGPALARWLFPVGPESILLARYFADNLPLEYQFEIQRAKASRPKFWCTIASETAARKLTILYYR